MPNAALIALTSPLLIGEVPDASLTQPDLTFAHAQRASSHLTKPTFVMLEIGPEAEWSLASQPSPQEPPEGTTETQQEPASEEENPDDTIVVSGTYGPREDDPIERVNEQSYRIMQGVDDALVEPIAYAYRDGLPDPIRDGLGNVVRNLGEPNNALNFLLQGKIGKTFETLGRLVINSTLGLGGLIDIAEKPGIGLPYRRNGFGNTLGFYGIGSGPYLYLPITGSTTARDVIGSSLDQLFLPVAIGKPFDQPEFGIPYFVVSNLDARLEIDAELDRIGETIDPYAAQRDTYLYRRAKTIAELRGKEPPEPPAILEEVEGTGEFAPALPEAGAIPEGLDSPNAPEPNQTEETNKAEPAEPTESAAPIASTPPN